MLYGLFAVKNDPDVFHAACRPGKLLLMIRGVNAGRQERGKGIKNFFPYFFLQGNTVFTWMGAKILYLYQPQRCFVGRKRQYIDGLDSLMRFGKLVAVKGPVIEFCCFPAIGKAEGQAVRSNRTGHLGVSVRKIHVAIRLIKTGFQRGNVADIAGAVPLLYFDAAICGKVQPEIARMLQVLRFLQYFQFAQ